MFKFKDIGTGEKPRTPRLKTGLSVISAIIILAAVVAAVLHGFSNGPVPRDIQKQTNFRIYYPAQNKLPAGYSIDKSSFRTAEANVVLFSLSYGNGRSLVFSESPKPSGDVIDKFNASAIPVHTQVSTSVGKATVGAYGSGKDLRTIASLPVNDGPWLILTAPSDIDQNDLQQVLQAITR